MCKIAGVEPEKLYLTEEMLPHDCLERDQTAA